MIDMPPPAPESAPTLSSSFAAGAAGAHVIGRPLGADGAISASPAMRTLLLALAVAFAVLAIDCRVLRARKYFGFDFYQCWVMGRTLRSTEPVGDIYTDSERDRIGTRFWHVAYESPLANERQREAAEFRTRIDTTGTPFFYLAFAPFACERFETAYDAYVALDLGLLLVAVVALGHLWGFSPMAIAVAVGLTFTSRPVVHDIVVLNVSSLQAGLCVLYLLLRHRTTTPARLVGAGLFLGLLVAFKPNLAFVPILLGAHRLLRRQWRPLMTEMTAAGAAVVFAIVVSSTRFGTVECWVWWLRTLHTFYAREDMAIAGGSLSIARLVFDCTGRDVSTVLSLALLSTVLGAMVWQHRRDGIGEVDEDDFTTPAILLGMGVLVAILGGTLAWHHYPVMTLPLAVYCCRPARPEHRWCRATLVRYGLAAAMVATLYLHCPTDWPRAQGMLWRAVIAQVGMVLLFVMGVWFLAAGGRTTAARDEGDGHHAGAGA